MEPEVTPTPVPAPERLQIQARQEKLFEPKEEIASGKSLRESLRYKLSRDERLAARKAAKPRNVRKAEREAAALERAKEEGNQ